MVRIRNRIMGAAAALWFLTGGVAQLAAEPPANAFDRDSRSWRRSEGSRYLAVRPTEPKKSAKRWKKAWIVSWLAFAAVNVVDAHSSQGRLELNPLLRNSQGTFSTRKAVLIKGGIGGAFFGMQWWLARKSPSGLAYKAFTIANGAMTVGLTTSAVHNYGVAPVTAARSPGAAQAAAHPFLRRNP